MNRRTALLGLAGLTAACASADRISFDRGAFAITFTKLVTTGLQLLADAIAKNTKNAVPNAYALRLIPFRDALVTLQEQVEKAIIEAPARSRELEAAGIDQAVSVLQKAIPLILPLIAAV